MAILEGFYLERIPQWTRDHLNMVPLDLLGGVLYEERGCSGTPPGASGLLTRNEPVETYSTVINGVHAHSFQDDFYYRVHVVPSQIDVGNMLSAQTHDVEVWNAWPSPQLLTASSSTNAEGITVQEPAPSPLNFGPLASKTYTVVITTNGPPIIDAGFQFQFPEEEPVLTVVGRRVLVWSFMPQTQHSETLEFKTDLISTYDNEQRIALRNAPRQSLVYNYQLTPDEYKTARATAESWSFRDYGVPVWGELTRVGPVPLGTSELVFNTLGCDYRESGLLVVWGEYDHFEAAEITQVLPDKVVLKAPLEKSFGLAYVCPLRFGRALSGVTFTKGAQDTIGSKVEFNISDNINVEDGRTLFPIYRGAEVYNLPNFAASDLTDKLSRTVDTFDNGSGLVEVIPTRGYNRDTQSVAFDTLTRDERWGLRQWVHSLRGRQRSFWVPSWVEDMVVADVYQEGSSLLSVLPFGYSLYYTIKDFMVVLTDGTVYFNRSLSASVDSGGGETLALAGPFPASFSPGEVQRVCFLTLCRLDADKITFKHGYGGRTTLTVPLVGVPE